MGDSCLCELAITLRDFNKTLTTLRVLGNFFDQRSLKLFKEICDSLDIDIKVYVVDETKYYCATVFKKSEEQQIWKKMEKFKEQTIVDNLLLVDKLTQNPNESHEDIIKDLIDEKRKERM